MYKSNAIIEKLPKHLLDLVIDQPYNDYTMQDHAVWRYVMRQNIYFLKDVAHKSYLSGLDKTGVSINQIPQMYGMNRILKEIGWAAVAVDGFIPPSAFMEFQAYNVLVIAADIRPLDQIEYTPAPDIIHEAAGHAPIIANPEYAEYLRKFGFYGSKAFASEKDHNVYKAVRHLSILKADPYTKKEEVEAAEQKIEQIQSTIGARSELAKIRNLHWWTVEYGLIGSMYFPKIYGAGLLSSIGESYKAIQDGVLKLPFSIEAMNYNFDITTMQPQLFVTTNFNHLIKVLEEFVDTMAYRTGGKSGIKKAIDSKSIACICLDSGLQISGQAKDFLEENNEVIYARTIGPTGLSYNNKQLESHAKTYHNDGYSTPVGSLKNLSIDFPMFNDLQLESAGIKLDAICDLEWNSGIKLKGKLIKILRKSGKVILLTFESCTVRYQDKILFQSEWGKFDLAIGNKITSVYNGPADPDAYGHNFEVPKEKTHKITHTTKAIQLHKLYAEVRSLRELNSKPDNSLIQKLFDKLKKDYPTDWLLTLEILELAINSKLSKALVEDIESYLSDIKNQNPEFTKLIDDGLKSIS